MISIVAVISFIAVAAYCLGVVLYDVAQWLRGWWLTRRERIATARYNAIAACPPMTLDSRELSDRSQFVLMRHQSERPWFVSPKLLDGGEVVRRNDFGAN